MWRGPPCEPRPGDAEADAQAVAEVGDPGGHGAGLPPAVIWEKHVQPHHALDQVETPAGQPALKEE